MRAALYARVSTERQERYQTIDSQLAALRAWAAAGGHVVADEHVVRDEGYSGSRLDRPGLDALRDAVRDGAIGIVAVLTPDRLARRYAYQVLLLEEFRRAGVEVMFLQHPISDDPNDQLLLQIQGAIAEYERAVLGERFRRGKLQRARDGHYQGGCAPYGYRYVPRQDAVPGHLMLDEREAEMVRTLYGWLIDEQMTIRQILKRLNAGPYFPRSGRHPWSPSVVHHILADPVYAGTAYANRYSFVPPKRPRRGHGPRTGEATCRQLKPREQWIAIPVPVIVDARIWGRAQAQLARNATLSFRNNTKYSYLLRCLMTCASCGLAMFGRTYAATASQPERRYYQCHGKDCILTARPAACPSRNVKAEEIEGAVWDHVASLLADPDQLLARFDHFAATAEGGSARDQAAEQHLRARLDRTTRADKRLLDAYEAGAITLAELSERRRHLAEERRGLERQQQERDRLCQQRIQAQAVRTSLEAFCARVHGRLDEATFADKQAILQLVIERIIVGDGSLEIRHVIPLRPPQPSGDGPVRPTPQLRSDREHRAALLEALAAELAALEARDADHPKAACQLMASRRFGRYLAADAVGRPRLDPAKVKAAERLDGKFVVTTNDDSLTAEDAALGYKGAWIIEACFRKMKQTGLEIRPIYHWSPRRITAHVKLCVLALQMQRAAELRTGLPWARLAHELAALKAVRYRTEARTIVQRTRVPAALAETTKKLGVSMPKQLLAMSEPATDPLAA
jgi:site-specific DNA recombinase